MAELAAHKVTIWRTKAGNYIVKCFRCGRLDGRAIWSKQVAKTCARQHRGGGR